MIPGIGNIMHNTKVYLNMINKMIKIIQAFLATYCVIGLIVSTIANLAFGFQIEMFVGLVLFWPMYVAFIFIIIIASMGQM